MNPVRHVLSITFPACVATMAALLATSGLPATAYAVSPHLSSAALQQLAAARAATAKYHNVEAAIADGYFDVGAPYLAGEGLHYLKPSLINGCTFDPARPQVLKYAFVNPNSTRLQLVALEYIVPDTCTTLPEGFVGDADEWEGDEPVPFFVLSAWIWLDNPDGIFTELNPRIQPIP